MMCIPGGPAGARVEIRVNAHLEDVALPENLRINDQITAYRDACRKSGCNREYHHFAFGQSPFPPTPTVVAALSRHAAANTYLPTAGMPVLRELIAEHYRREFGLDCAAEQVLAGPGSKELIAVALTAVEGPLIVPAPSWISYLPQARIAGKPVVTVRLRREDDFKLTPERLLSGLQGTPNGQTILILNAPRRILYVRGFQRRGRGVRQAGLRFMHTVL